jgi:hypothetical protein
MLFLPGKIRKCKKKLSVLCDEMLELEAMIMSVSSKKEKSALQKRIDKLDDEISSLKENEYAKAVYDLYSSKKPKLYSKRTKKTYKWDEVFGKDFSKMSYLERCHLVGLIEKDGAYTIK